MLGRGKNWVSDNIYMSQDQRYYLCFSQFRPEELIVNNKPFIWTPLIGRYKPGVTSYDFPVYEMTQYGRFKDKSSAGKLVSDKIGKIVKPMKGDFGLNKKLEGNWLCEGASVRYDGKYWIGTITYIHSADAFGWDQDLYDKD